ncbi:hypothetical protein L596_021438 [Steinernema carpocapsae]|uniref:Uncharacterized protein n=1 Tax=Steinernema carpocapsae TaxID=34508 RepID=A0A4U5MIR3_STECR|nr:hypothetical protein L596_021438 [Steinernema carpocapsae]
MVADNVDEALYSVNKLLKEANRTVSHLSSAVSYVPLITFIFFAVLSIMVLACILFVAFQYYVGHRLYQRHKENNPIRSRHSTPESGRLIKGEQQL